MKIFVRFAGSAEPTVYDVDNPQRIISQFKMCSEVGYPGERTIEFTTVDGMYVCLGTQHILAIEMLQG